VKLNAEIVYAPLIRHKFADYSRVFFEEFSEKFLKFSSLELFSSFAIVTAFSIPFVIQTSLKSPHIYDSLREFPQNVFKFSYDLITDEHPPRSFDFFITSFKSTNRKPERDSIQRVELSKLNRRLSITRGKL
jgi:hypothetical protein